MSGTVNLAKNLWLGNSQDPGLKLLLLVCYMDIVSKCFLNLYLSTHRLVSPQTSSEKPPPPSDGGYHRHSRLRVLHRLISGGGLGYWVSRFQSKTSKCRE